MIKAIIFDFDGTLFHANIGKETIGKVCSKLNIAFDTADWEKLLGKNREDRIQLLFPERKKEILEKFNSEYELVFANKIKPLGDSLKAIPLLSSNYKLFIFSTKYVSLIKSGLEKNNLENHFLEIIGWESFENKKPHNEGIDFLFKKYNLKKDEVVLVGDTPLDLLASKNSGIKFILFENPFDKQTLQEFDFKIKSHLELIELLPAFS